jgi:hypothetical protein
MTIVKEATRNGVKGHMQSHRASLAFRDEQYDRAHAAAARSPAVREFYANEATVDHRFGERRLTAARLGKPLKAP